MQLHKLLYGKSKKKMHPIMIDTFKKCQNYRDARQNLVGWHVIVLADKGETVWRKKSATIGGNNCDIVPVINRHGTTRHNGYISKDGFQSHT